MAGNEEITLVHSIAPDNPTDANGFPNPPTEEMGTVFANKKSVGFAEFYQAHLAGFRAELKFDVYTAEYNDEKQAIYEGVRYDVKRTYGIKNGEFTELTLYEIAKGGRESG